MITFHLREFTHTFFQHILVIPEQDITFEETYIQDHKFLRFTGCDYVVLRLTSIGLDCIDKNTFGYYMDENGTHKIQVQPKYDGIAVEILDKENGVVYETFTHRQDIAPNTRRLETVC